MNDFITNFETTQEFAAVSGNTDIIKRPHFSLTRDDMVVHYIPAIRPIMVAKYNITQTGSIRIASRLSAFTKIEVDGVMQEPLATSYTFTTLGEHTVKYTLADPTKTGEYALTACTEMTSVDIPSTVETICGTFSECTSLTSVTLPYGVKNVGEYDSRGFAEGAFDGCTSLTSIYMPDSVEYIGNSAFYGDTALSSINIPNNCEVGDAAFQDCTSLPVYNNIHYADTYAVRVSDTTLTTYTIKSGTRFVGIECFFECQNLTGVTGFPNVTELSQGMFRNCVSLKSFTIPNTVEKIGRLAFKGCSSLTNMVIPDKVSVIKDGIFSGCTSLLTVTFGSGLTSVASGYLFYRCNSMQSITFNSVTPPSGVDTRTFASTNSCPIYVPSGSVNAYKTASGWSNYASRIQAIP